MANQSVAGEDPSLLKLKEALQILVKCAQTYYYDEIKNSTEKVTLATQARYYNLKKTNEILVRLIVSLFNLFRFRVSMNEARERIFIDFFERLDQVSCSKYCICRPYRPLDYTKYETLTELLTA